jgi:hypothetical protein
MVSFKDRLAQVIELSSTALTLIPLSIRLPLIMAPFANLG